MIKNNLELAILVNTSDGFKDCWDPFFILFDKYFKNCKYPIYLNTEFEEYSFKDLNIISLKVHEFEKVKKLTWSECLINALNKIDSKYILYFQEDYFLESKVNTDIMEDALRIIELDSAISRIGLTSINHSLKSKETVFNSFVEVSRFDKYRLSTQVSIWRKNSLLKYLDKVENGWMFEIFGSKRSSIYNEKILSLDPNKYTKKNNPFPYLLTGIIKGKWNLDIPSSFEKNNIKIDFSKRGFYKKKNTILTKIETFKKLFNNPSLSIRQFLKICLLIFKKP